MSDLCVYDFEDTVWDEFCHNDDHLVPHPGFERTGDHSILGDNQKKHCREVTRDRYTAGHNDLEREDRGFSFPSKRRNTMLEKESWSPARSGISPLSNGGSLEHISNLASDNTMSSGHGIKSNITDSNGSKYCANDTIAGDKTANNNSFSYHLGEITDTGNDLDFFGDAEDKDSSDFFYNGWPEIGNFEDIDRMFRSCDSTFGVGASKEDELSWLSSADNIGGSEDANSDFKFSCPGSNTVENISENNDSSQQYCVGDSAMAIEPIRYQGSYWISNKSESYTSFVDGTTLTDNKDAAIPQEQGVDAMQARISTSNHLRTSCSRLINEHQKQFKVPNQSLGRRKEHCTRSLSYSSSLSNEVTQLPCATPNQVFYIQQRQQAAAPDSYGFLQNPPSYVHSDSSHLSDPNLVTDTVGSERKEKLHSRQTKRPVNNSIKNANAAMQASLRDPGSIENQVHFSGDKFENHRNIEGVSTVVPAELGSSNLQESSTVSSDLNDISVEAASFRQLQHVMEQLDLKTKLCIRDSLYRLARSAEQRHNHANLSGSFVDERYACRAVGDEGANNFMDMETNTNPIDRSIAHLLFHRPSESSARPPHDLRPPKVQGSVTSPSIMEENLVISEETTESKIDEVTNV